MPRVDNMEKKTVCSIATVSAILIILAPAIIPAVTSPGAQKNSLPHSSPPADSFPMALSRGWNLLSLPFTPANTSVESVFFTVNEKIDAVQYYDASNNSDHWKIYRPSADPEHNDLKSVDSRMGLWVSVTNASGFVLHGNGSIPKSVAILLLAGWNLIGYPSMVNRTVSEVFQYFPPWAQYEVNRYDAGSKYGLKSMGALEVFHAGLGYWVYVSVDFQLRIYWA